MNTLDRYNNIIFAYQYEYSEGNNSNHGDIEYYISKLSGINSPLLELACGTGRITIPLKKCGVNITGLDHAQAMIEIAREKALKENVGIDFIVDDAVSFKLNDKFGAIFMPYNSISFIDNARVNAFSRNIKKHLLPGGKFLFDISRASMDSVNNKRSVNWSDEIFIKELGVSLRRKMEMTSLPDENITESIYYWEILHQDGRKELKETKMHFSTYPVEIYIDIFRENGFILNEQKTENNGQKDHYFVELILQ